MVSRLVLGLIRFYRRAISPWRPPACRFIPTCSEYATEAIERHGALRGGGLALRRLLRCNPLGGAGWDPVPGSGRTEGRSDDGRGRGRRGVDRAPGYGTPAGDEMGSRR